MKIILNTRERFILAREMLLIMTRAIKEDLEADPSPDSALVKDVFTDIENAVEKMTPRNSEKSKNSIMSLLKMKGW